MLQGYPSQAVQRARRSLDEAQDIEHAVTLSIVLRHAALLFLWIGDLQSAEEVINWYIAAADHAGSPITISFPAIVMTLEMIG